MILFSGTEVVGSASGQHCKQHEKTMAMFARVKRASMKKSTSEKIYAVIFLLSLILHLFSVWEYLTSDTKNWFVSSLSWIIMLLSLWGYSIVKKNLKMKEKPKPVI